MPDSLLNPIELAVGLAFVLLIAFVLFEGVKTPGPDIDPAVEAAPRKPLPRRGLVAAASCVLLLALAVGGCVYANAYEPLRAEGPAVGSGALYLGTAPATYGGNAALVFAEAAEGVITFQFTLANTGEFPLTVTGMNEPLNGSPMWEMDGYFQSGFIRPAGAPGPGTPGRFEIGAHSSVHVEVGLRFRPCGSSTPSAALAPGRSPSSWAAVGAVGGRLSFFNLAVVYQTLGLTKVARVVLPSVLEMVDNSSINCPNLNGGPPPTSTPS
jgi:hypothetical protein